MTGHAVVIAGGGPTGTVTAPAGVLIRPDGHVAWAGDLINRGSPARSPPGSDRLARRNTKGTLAADPNATCIRSRYRQRGRQFTTRYR